MTPRFHVPELTPAHTDVSLPPDEAAHLVRVLRLGIGASVRLFNGAGFEVQGVVDRVGRHDAVVRITGAVAAVPEPPAALHLVQAVLKADGMDQVVRDVVMLGVASITPVVSARSETTLGRMQRSGRLERWRRIAVASTKQCGSAVVPPIHEIVSLTEYLDRETAHTRYVLVEPAAAGAAAAPSSRLAARDPLMLASVLVGPEGGWTSTEVASAVGCGCVPLTLGPRTFRATTAALIALTALHALSGALSLPE